MPRTRPHAADSGRLMGDPLPDWWDYVDCRGRTVLDLGGYDGGYGAKPALERGAVSAIVVDNGEWAEYGWPVPNPEHAGIQFKAGDLLAWKEPADIVVCSNVIYHLRDPFAGLRHLRSLTGERLAMRTSTVTEDEAGKDGWKWYLDGMGHENGTVWARPCESGLLRSLAEVGFTEIQKVDGYGGLIVVARPGEVTEQRPRRKAA